jgi:hypothetical protein
MTATTNFHHVKSITLSQRELAGTDSWITDVIAMNGKGETYTLTLFHAGPMPIGGAEFVNFVAQPEEA